MNPKMYIKIFLILIICSLVLYAQSQVKTGVIAGGGGMMDNNSHRIIGTVAQPIVGFSSNENNGITSGFWFEMFLTTATEQDHDLLPMKFNLSQNYPNPFNPATTIFYSIPERSSVTIKVYDVLGNEVKTLVNDEKERGVYSIVFDASNLASGIYFYRIQAGNFTAAKKLMLLK